MIAAEYGWSDDIIMELTVRRTVQILASIKERRRILKLDRDLVTEWQTKVLAGFIASTVQVPKGKSNPLAKEVDKIRLVNEQDKQEIASQTAPEADPEVFVEEGSQVAAERNKIGSFERLHQGFREKIPQQ